LLLDLAERDALLNLVDGRAVSEIPCVGQARRPSSTCTAARCELAVTIRQACTPLIGWSPLLAERKSAPSPVRR
jgi:hypothetical protein